MLADNPHGRNSQPLGVGIIGAGSVVQGIHLPTLARLSELFSVRHVSDINADAAAYVARQVSARASTSVDELLADPEVDVVAICSPHTLHVDHVLAACAAGVRAILCEKPMATTVADARRMAEAVRASKTPLIIGAMHLFDPAWTFLERHRSTYGTEVGLVRSSIFLPFNDRFEQWATEPSQPGPMPDLDHSTPQGRAESLTTQLLGLAIHDLPLVRTMTPAWQDLEVTFADAYDPIGYRVQLRAGRTLIELSGGFRDHWETEWEFEASGPQYIARAGFTPSFVQAGSGTAEVRGPSDCRSFAGDPANGYEGEWRAIADAATDPAPYLQRIDGFVDDLDFALRVAERAAQFVSEEAQHQ